MKGFYYATLMLSTIFITNVLTSSNLSRHVQEKAYINTYNPCENLPDFTYIRDSKDFNKYYRCFGGKAKELKSKDGAFFNLKPGACYTIKETECAGNKPCKGKKDGDFIKDPKKCDGYYACFNEETDLHGECLKGQWFVESEQACDWKENVKADDCKNRCEGKEFGFVVVPDGTCEKYYSCRYGEIIGDPEECGEGKLFNSSIEHCVNKSEYECTSNSSGK